MRLVSLIFIAIITFVIILMVKRPDLLKDFWLWLIGFAGIIVHAFQVILSYIKELYSKTANTIIEKKDELTSKHLTKKA